VARVISESASVRIERPAEVVWDYFTDVSHDPDWNPSAIKARKTSEGPLGVGSTFHVVRKMSGPMDLEYTEYSRPLRWSIRGVGRGITFTYAAELAPSGAGTELTSHMNLEPKGVFAVAGPLIRIATKRQLEEVHAALKRKLESAGAERP
jgi:carbon monoxide dehydrogenase subunit G